MKAKYIVPKPFEIIDHASFDGLMHPSIFNRVGEVYLLKRMGVSIMESEHGLIIDRAIFQKVLEHDPLCIVNMAVEENKINFLSAKMLSAQ